MAESGWLAGARAELERLSGTELSLDNAEIDELLRLARFGAEASGAKLNAPLLCYLVGRAVEAGGLSVADAAAAVTQLGATLDSAA